MSTVQHPTCVLHLQARLAALADERFLIFEELREAARGVQDALEDGASDWILEGAYLRRADAEDRLLHVDARIESTELDLADLLLDLQAASAA